jgi:hypothetical protein
VTTYLQGATATLVVLWRQYAPDGPLVDVNNPTVTITPLAGGAATVGPTAVGVTHPATGTNVYNWAIPAAQTPGDYLVEWDALDAGTGDPVSASEIVTVAATVTATMPVGLCEVWDPIWCCDLPTGSAAVTGNALAAATEVLWAASAQRFGLCQVTIRPCRRDCYGRSWPFVDSWWEWTGTTWPHPMLFDGVWTNVACGSCPGTCSCGVLEEAVLPAPVYDVVQVKVDGLPLATDAYRLDDGRILVRVNGGRWPACQDLSLADTEVGTWSVTARFGQPVPTLGRQAVGELACEMAKACLGVDCRLPRNVQQLVRQGVTVSFPENTAVAERLYWAKLFVDTYNPHHLAGRPAVYDVDGPGFRRAGT